MRFAGLERLLMLPERREELGVRGRSGPTNIAGHAVRSAVYGFSNGWPVERKLLL